MLIFQGVTDQRLEGFFLDSSTIPTWLGLRTAESLLKWSCHLKKSKMAEQISYIHVFFRGLWLYTWFICYKLPFKIYNDRLGLPTQKLGFFFDPWFVWVDFWNPPLESQNHRGPEPTIFPGNHPGIFWGNMGLLYWVSFPYYSSHIGILVWEEYGNTYHYWGSHVLGGPWKCHWTI